MPASFWADIQNEDYDHFIEGRAERISKELKKGPVDSGFRRLR
jgi:hypothetical protein